MAVGCYTPLYLPCSFKGVRFTAVDSESEHGRRGAEGEFPFSEMTAYADLGRRIRRYQIRGVFRENSHLADARRLIRAVESPGPGILSHPHLGSVMAACKSLRIRNDIEQGQGETTVDLDFVEANRWGAGFGLGPLSLIGLNILPIITATQAFFTSNFAPFAAPFFLTTAVGGLAARMVGIVHNQLLLSSGLRVDDGGFMRAAEAVRAVADSALLATDAAVAWNGLAGGFSALDRYALTPEARVLALRTIANTAAALKVPDPNLVMPHEIVLGTTRLLAGAYMARAGLTLRAQTMQEALTVYDGVTTLLEAEQEYARTEGYAELAIRLDEFMPDMRAALLNRAYNLPPLIEYDFGHGVWSLVAAHEITGDARKFRDIENLNARALPFALGPKVVAPRQEGPATPHLGLSDWSPL